MSENEKKDIQIPSFVLDKEEYHEPKEEIRRQVEKEKEEIFHLQEEPIEEDDKGEKRLSPVVMILITLAIVMAVALVVLGIMHIFDSESKPSTLPTDKPTTTKEPAATATPTPTTTPTPATTPTPSEKPITTPVPTQNTTTSINETAQYVLKTAVKVRKGPGLSYDPVESIPAKYSSNANGKSIEEGTTVDVLEIKNDENSTWGKIADNAWLCLKIDGEALASKK